MRRYLIFAAVGPLLGGFWLLLASTLQSGYWSRPPSLAEIGKLLAVFVTTLQYSYLFGLLPALMIGAVDDILFHIKPVGPVLRMLLVGAIAFITTALIYSSRGADSGALQFVMFGLVGFIPATISSFLVHRFVEEQPRAKPA
jgi:FtsH-binding integral membrane protein